VICIYTVERKGIHLSGVGGGVASAPPNVSMWWKWHPTCAESHEDLLHGGHPNNGHEKIFAQNVAQTFSGKGRAKILPTPKNLPAPTSMIHLISHSPLVTWPAVFHQRCAVPPDHLRSEISFSCICNIKNVAPHLYRTDHETRVISRCFMGPVRVRVVGKLWYKNRKYKTIIMPIP